MAVSIIRKTRLETFIRRLGGTIFTISFFKANGHFRVMNCRKGVHLGKGLKGNRKKNGTWTSSIRVFDMQKRQYRSVNLAKAVSLKVNGIDFQIVN